MAYIILFLLTLLLVKISSDLITYSKAITISDNGIKFASDKDHGLVVDGLTGESFLTEKPVLRP
jgi:hypothetical protein